MARRRAQSDQRPDHRSLVAALERPECYGPGVHEVRLVETHISWVFLTGKRAYKVKKPVKLPFVDFSTLELRKRFCDEELRLNRRLAGELYLGVVPIGGSPDAPRVGATPAFEYAIEMRQFPDDARLDRQLEAGSLPTEALLEFADTLAQFHGELPAIRPPADAAAATLRSAATNLDELEPYLVGELANERQRIAALRDWTKCEGEAIRPALESRAAHGAHRECHGDLHLENLLLTDGRVVAFDALEFDRKLREIDVASETSFLAMDLLAHERADLAYAFLTRYLEAGGDYAGLAVQRYYLVYRALIRAKVRALKVAQRHAERGREAPARYLALASELIAPGSPLLIVTHGLSGSGKTHVTGELVLRLPALRVRSDLERKRLLGLAADARTASPVGGGSYGERSTERTYERLAEVAGPALAHGFDLIVDGTFLRRTERESFRGLAARAGARFAILDCVAPEAELRRRIGARAARGRDASEATGAVLDWQLENQEPLDAGELAEAVRVDTTADVDYGGLAARLARR
ncbi:MAG TPA: AAA family ATPase [Gammaproteobacteria bacterium]|nr:AAA family ATPase [Gammaproteobacteria bacterium]